MRIFRPALPFTQFCGQCQRNPLAELNQRIFNSTNGSLIFIVNILQDCKCANLPDNPGKQSVCIFRIISYTHKLVTQLRKQSFNSFSRFGKSRICRLPHFLVSSVWYFQSDIGRFKQIQLYLSTYISSITYDSTVTYSLPSHPSGNECHAHLPW